MRAQDKPVLDAALTIARSEGSDITTVFRAALAEFVRTKASQAGARRIDEFIDETGITNPIYNRVLTPKELRNWSEASVLYAARLIRSRKEELDSELQRRGYYFSW